MTGMTVEVVHCILDGDVEVFFNRRPRVWSWGSLWVHCPEMLFDTSQICEHLVTDRAGGIA